MPNSFFRTAANHRPFGLAALVGLGILLAASPSQATNAHFLHGAGVTDEAMGGSTIAAPQDTIGSLYNNVGNLTQFPGTRVDVNLEVVRSHIGVESQLGGLHGETQSDSDPGLIPSFGVAHTPQGSDVTYFLGALGVSGFGTDYPQDDENPIFRPQIENGANTGGFGSVYSFYGLLRITGGIAVKVTPRLSLGIAPTINYATLAIRPFPGAHPDCTAQGVCAYPSAAAAAPALGGGFLLGLHYRLTDTVAFGLGYTSPQWFTTFHWNSTVANPELDTFGKGRRLSFRLNAPQSVQFGVGWEPMPDLLLTSSGKWMNLADTTGLGDEGFDAAGRLRGFGWKNIWATGVGAQYRLTSALAVRLGYNYSEDPIQSRFAIFSAAAPASMGHHATGGLGVTVSEHVEVNFAYWHAFTQPFAGPFVSPAGPVPNSRAKTSPSEDSLSFAVSFKL